MLTNGCRLLQYLISIFIVETFDPVTWKIQRRQKECILALNVNVTWMKWLFKC